MIDAVFQRLFPKRGKAFKDTVEQIADIHTHILPYADDGAADLEEAAELLSMQVQQGVTAICLTPHLRDGMFSTSDEKIQSVYVRLLQLCQEQSLPLRLHLSREYYYDDVFCGLLEKRALLPMGKNVLLVEFGYHTAFEVMTEAAQKISASGYAPMFAHVERYSAIQQQPELVSQLTALGVLIQLNADGILGREGTAEKRTCQYLLKNRFVFAVTSDCHDTVERTPNLQSCSKLLVRKFGREYASSLMHDNPMSIFTLSTKELSSCKLSP